MSEHFKPENTAQLCEAVKWAAGAGQALEIAGTGSKRAIGNVMETDHLL
ncbi:MAG TPA: 2-hydroxy-acid oxidase, partial [Rhizobiales bacterium]|nr:2-hydroxy-acid oxidase [Hyphomicrobiales bacterium]